MSVKSPKECTALPSLLLLLGRSSCAALRNLSKREEGGKAIVLGSTQKKGYPNPWTSFGDAEAGIIAHFSM